MASRVKNSAMNIVAAFCCQFLAQASNFIVRTVFIRVLATEYLGINSLFTNILQMLSLAELGVGAALIYSMYKPMAEKNESVIAVYMGLYRRIYRSIGILVLGIGVALLPFLDFFISSRPEISESLEFIYVLYVIRTSSTYFFAYKQAVFQADQKTYVISRNTLIFTILKSVIEIVILMVFQNFVVYLLVAVICNFLQNIWISRLADKEYPCIKDKAPKADSATVKELFKNVKAMFMHKVSAVVLNSTDSIILSKFVGIVTVGLYSNYSMIIVLIRNCLNMIFDGVAPSVGNLCAEKRDDEIYSVFRIILYGNIWLSGFCSLAMYFLFDPFITIWVGAEYLLGNELVLSIVISFYVQMNMRAIDLFRSATGLFYDDRYVAIIQCIINVVASIIFVKMFGAAGIFVGTSVAMLTTVCWVKPLLVYKKVFKLPVMDYYVRYFSYTIIWLVAGILTYQIVNLVQAEGLLRLLYVSICVALIPNALFFAITFKTTDFLGLLNVGRGIVSRKKKGM